MNTGGSRRGGSGSRWRRDDRKIDAAYAAALWYRSLQETSNDTFMPLFFDQHRFLVLKGGGGSGKSVFAARKVVERAVSEPGHRFLVARKVGNTLRHSCFEDICATISRFYPDSGATIYTGEMRIIFPNGSDIIFKGLDNAEKLKSIHEVTDVWIEEATELTESDFNQLDIRMRGATRWYQQMIITFNPISILHWIKKRFFDCDEPELRADIRTHESTYLDNRFLPERNKKVLEKFRFTDPYFYQVYCLGEWGVTGKTVFPAMILAERLRYLQSAGIRERALLGAFDVAESGEQIDYTTSKFTASDAGFIRVYRKPEKGVPYVIGADTAGEGSDWFVAQVLDNRTGEQVAVLRKQMDEDMFVKQVYCLGRWYNDALIAPETNFSTFPVRELQRLRYPRMFVRDSIDDYGKRTTRTFGFRTDTKSRPVIIAELVRVVREHPEVLNDIDTIGEMLTFVRDENFKPCAEEGAHDDCVMSLAIAHYLRPYQDCIAKSPETDERVEWHPSQWEDYDNATAEEKRQLIKLWGRPKPRR